MCGCEISRAARPSDDRVSRPAKRSAYGPRASPRPRDAAADRQVSAALAPVPGPQLRPRDAAAAPSAAAHPRLRPPRPHLRSPADRPAEDRRPPRRGAVAAHGSVAATIEIKGRSYSSDRVYRRTIFSFSLFNIFIF